MVPLYLVMMAAIAAFACFEEVASVPLEQRLRDLTPKARNVLKRATPVAPHFVLYSDAYVSSEPTVSEISGFNVFALSFLEQYGAADQAQEWEELTASQRSSILSEYEAAGISLIVSLFGSTETPTSSGYDPIDTANTMAAWVIEYGLQGVDVDYEDFAAFDAGTGAAEQWLGNFTTQLRTQLPQGQYILTHAPVAPWFTPNYWGGGGYLWVDSVVGSLIDWYNVQFYNQGTTEYTTCDGLLFNSSTSWPESALFQIADSGISLDKLVIGKPATAAQATNGYMAPSLLASCVSSAYADGWNGGVMVWEYPDANSSWIATVRGNTWPMSVTTTSTSTVTVTTTVSTITTTVSTTTTATTPTSTSTSAPGTTCAGVAAWTTGVAYTGGSEVTYDGYLWTASYWSENDTPGGTSGVWINDGACTSTATAAPKHRALLAPMVTPALAL
jgi:chitinase